MVEVDGEVGVLGVLEACCDEGVVRLPFDSDLAPEKGGSSTDSRPSATYP